MTENWSRTSQGSTELGYIFTFMLGVLFLSLFSVWAFGLETSTKKNWNTTAVDVNMADIAARFMKEPTLLAEKMLVLVMLRL